MKLIKNPITRRRWNRFREIRRAYWSSWIFAFMIFLSLTAEFWANSKPIVMKYNQTWYWPALKTYHPSLFAQNDTMVTDYRKLEIKAEDWVLWPPISWDPFESNVDVENYPSPPSIKNLLGTDDRGRDVLTRLIYGFRYSIAYALLVWMSAYLLGIIIGATMGYFGGKVDLWGQRLVEIYESVPTLMLLITLISIFGSNLWLLTVFSALFGWMMMSIYIRAEFLRLRRREFVEAARAMGSGELRIIFKHILPNALSPVMTFSSFSIAGGIAALASLDYLGFGLPAPTPSWGELLNQAQRHFTLAWWLAVFPSLALFTALVVLNLIGEGLRESFDPRK